MRLSKARISLICLITCVVAVAAMAQDTGSSTEQTQCIAGKKQQRVAVEITKFRQDSEAYEFLSKIAAQARARHAGVEIQTGYGTAGFADEGEISFFKGTAFVRLKGGDPETLKECAQQFSRQ